MATLEIRACADLGPISARFLTNPAIGGKTASPDSLRCRPRPARPAAKAGENRGVAFVRIRVPGALKETAKRR